VAQIYYIFCAIFGWPAFSFATISSVQTVSSNLNFTCLVLFGEGQRSLPKTLKDIDAFHTSLQLPPDPDVDLEPYPLTAACHPAGMQIEFRYIRLAPESGPER
jgi:hypothetical protein